MLIALSSLIVGLLVLALRQQFIKREYIKEKSIVDRVLYIVGVVLMCALFPMYIYHITDTLMEWLCGVLVLMSIFGVEWLAGWGIKKVKYNFWIMPLVGIFVFIGVDIFSKLIISSVVPMITGIVASLINIAACAKKDEVRHHRLILTEAIIIGILAICMVNVEYVETKPARIIKEQLTDIPSTCVNIKITQYKEAKRGEVGEFRAFLEEENDRLKEVRDYNYFNGEIELTDIQKFD